jgi:hypothetical protein
MLEVPAHGAGEDDAFKVASARDEVFDLVAMGDAGYILLDDRSVIEEAGDVVACRADKFDAARGPRDRAARR